ncbi:anthranilate synthase component 1 [Wohlfahrtiimonas chitiniclastica]|uniref:anthranilate synthase component 1 n=1 Tax=Wohlfahrtiimonas chitiniclastica TaxID=400946 RepID=UPI0007B69B5F|nr:anthranilate synthase component 1 [Wohlfahrtiimonas chitiniclastica]KZX38243.1 anthranilate synthase [Wohlfahrtiimonas chitiniclastica]
MTHSASYTTAALSFPRDPLGLYQALTQNRNHHLLYESADVDHQHALKSFLLTDAAIKIEGFGQEVILTALTDNGTALLELISNAPIHINLTAKTATQLIFTFPKGGQFSPMDVLRTVQSFADRTHDNEYTYFMAGLLGYDLVGYYYDIPVPETNRRGHDLLVYVAETLIIIDHVAKTADVQHNQFGRHQNMPFDIDAAAQQINQYAEHIFTPEIHGANVNSDIVEVDDPNEFLNTVATLIERVKAGEFQQIVPSRRFQVACPSAINAYAALKTAHPSPYLFYLQDDAFTLFGASPERALKFDHTSRIVELYPIAGTRPRGRVNDVIDPVFDLELEQDLLNDPKEVNEHMMLVDLAERDLTPIAKPGSFHVKDLMKVDRYAYVMHLVSNVQAQLQDHLDAFDAYIHTMNMGTLTGDPKIAAMTAIYEYEPVARGSYGGAIGYLNSFGDLDSCIVIRSANVQDGIATIQAGAGIVHDSVPERELAETRHKANSVIHAILNSH